MCMTLRRGVLEVISLANSTPKSFRDFTDISINKRKLSSATVSKILKELVAIKVLEEVVIRSKTGRRIIGYRTTERGKQILELAEELNKALKNSTQQFRKL